MGIGGPLELVHVFAVLHIAGQARAQAKGDETTAKRCLVKGQRSFRDAATDVHRPGVGVLDKTNDDSTRHRNAGIESR